LIFTSFVILNILYFSPVGELKFNFKIF
jgi:hypothetical protein